MNNITLHAQLLKKDSADAEKKRKFLALPVLFSSPETSLGAGFTSIYYFRTDTLSTTNPSSLRANAVYTLERQLLLELPFTIFTKGNKYWISGEMNYYIYPYEYYGQGTQINLSEFDAYNATFMRVFSDYMKAINPSLYVGLRQNYIRYFSIGAVSNNGIIPPGLTGFSQNQISGIGLGVIHDKRNNVFSPSGGSYMALNSMAYTRFTGSDFSFSDFSVDLRKYYAPSDKAELGFQFFHQSILGTAPFYAMANLGGSRLMRGYYEGAYRDNHYTAIQSEFRFYVHRKILMAAFSSLGTVTNSVGAINKLLPAGGIGFRYEVDSREKLRLRMDIAFGKESRGLYLGINETF